MFDLNFEYLLQRGASGLLIQTKKAFFSRKPNVKCEDLIPLFVILEATF
jgi:hypothetical protein